MAKKAPKSKRETPDATPTEATFQAFIENLPVMFYAVTPTAPHRPIYISPTFESFGYPLDQWKNDSDIWDRVIHPDDKDRVLIATRNAMACGESIDFEYRVVCADGRIVWVRDRSCFIHDRAGNPLCWQGIILDVTERRTAEHESQKREKLYRTLAQTIPRTAVLLFDHDYRYTLADGEQLKNHQWSKEMFEDKTLFEVFPPELSDEWSGYYERALAGERVTLNLDNDEGAFQVNVLPVHGEDGQIFAGMVMWQDVTEQKRADDILRESEERYRQLFENANDIIYAHDLNGNYISMNQAAERVLEYSREEMLAMNMKDIIAVEQLEMVREKLSQKITGDVGQTIYEVDCLRKDGSWATLEVNSSLIMANGEPIAVQGIARDITERKEAREAVRKSEERYRDLFENANDLIYTHDLTGNFTSLNRAGELITGYTREEALQKNICEVVAPEFLEAARTMAAKKIEGERPTTYELEIISKDGRRVTLDLSTRLIVSPEGLPLGVQGLGRDITQRRETEASLRKALSLFSSTFESTADGIVVMGLDQKIVTCNRKFIEMWGVDEAIIDSEDGSQLIAYVASQLKDPQELLENLIEVYDNP
ncbi:MAG: PAS domain S-box protein, partial [Pyrinomonadaceae bacterium]|nr:PAS domain S-box protein [Pyrinomonadaceae bacterium]